MLFLRKRILAGFLLVSFLWILSNLNLFGMFDNRAVWALSPITRGSEDSKSVSLMFNIDWGEEFLPDILSVLEEKDAKVTFFPTGTWASDNATILKDLHDKGHEIGNHGGYHAHVEWLPKEELWELIREGEKAIEKAIGVKCAPLFAPPYGEWNDSLVSYVSEIGYSTILWTKDTVDWQRPPPETIWKRALAGSTGGALILMHPTEPTLAALPVVIDGIREKGLELSTVSENLGIER